MCAVLKQVFQDEGGVRREMLQCMSSDIAGIMSEHVQSNLFIFSLPEMRELYWTASKKVMTGVKTAADCTGSAQYRTGGMLAMVGTKKEYLKLENIYL